MEALHQSKKNININTIFAQLKSQKFNTKQWGEFMFTF